MSITRSDLGLFSSDALVDYGSIIGYIASCNVAHFDGDGHAIPCPATATPRKRRKRKHRA